MKTDSAGNMLWAKSYGGSKGESFDAANITKDGGFLVGGHSYSFHSGANDYDAYIIRTDSNGNLLWSKSYGNDHIDIFFSMEEAGINQYIAAGIMTPAGTTYDDMCLLSLDSMGNVNWNKLIGLPSGLENIGVAHLSDRSIYILGTIRFTLNDFDRPYFVKTDSLGNSGCNTSSVGLNVMNAATNVTSINFTISNLSLSDTVYATTKDVLLTDTVLCFTTAVQGSPILEDHSINIFPNPTTGIVAIKAPFAIELVEITNAFGEKAFSAQPHSRNVTINLQNLPKGIYFYSVKTKNRTERGKIVLQ
jgi:hypothetical protein